MKAKEKYMYFIFLPEIFQILSYKNLGLYLDMDTDPDSDHLDPRHCTSFKKNKLIIINNFAVFQTCNLQFVFY
jgi:hypothetical protein